MLTFIAWALVALLTSILFIARANFIRLKRLYHGSDKNGDIQYNRLLLLFSSICRERLAEQLLRHDPERFMKLASELSQYEQDAKIFSSEKKETLYSEYISIYPSTLDLIQVGGINPALNFGIFGKSPDEWYTEYAKLTKFQIHVPDYLLRNFSFGAFPAQEKGTPYKDEFFEFRQAQDESSAHEALALYRAYKEGLEEAEEETPLHVMQFENSSYKVERDEDYIPSLRYRITLHDQKDRIIFAEFYEIGEPEISLLERGIRLPRFSVYSED